MKKILSSALLITLAGCSTSGQFPQVFRDPETNMYGFQGSSGVTVVPAEYTAARPFNDLGQAEVHHPEYGWIIIDKFGSQVK